MTWRSTNVQLTVEVEEDRQPTTGLQETTQDSATADFNLELTRARNISYSVR